MTIGLPNHANAASVSSDSNGRRIGRLVSIVARTGCYPLFSLRRVYLRLRVRFLSLFPERKTHIVPTGGCDAPCSLHGSLMRPIHCAQILGGSPGSASGSSFSRSLTTLGSGKNTVSRLFTLPFPLSFVRTGSSIRSRSPLPPHRKRRLDAHGRNAYPFSGSAAIRPRADSTAGRLMYFARQLRPLAL
jgi:hypothetical protein